MQQFTEFSLRHWELWVAFFLILGLLLSLELRDRLTGLRVLSPQEATLLINREDAIVLDLRSQELFNKGYIAGAVNIPLAELNAKVAQLEKYKDKPIIIVHATGQPLSKVTKPLKSNGFTNISYLKGGIPTWQSAGLPLLKN